VCVALIYVWLPANVAADFFLFLFGFSSANLYVETKLSRNESNCDKIKSALEFPKLDQKKKQTATARLIPILAFAAMANENKNGETSSFTHIRCCSLT
jgi:hypothetical protein